MWHWFVLSYFSGDAFQGELIGNLIFWCCRFGSPLLVQLSHCVACLCLHLVWNAHTFAASSPRLSSRPLLGSVLHMDCHSFLEYVSLFPPPGMRRRSQPWRHGVLLWIESAPPLFFDSVSSLRPRIWMSLSVALSLLLPPEFWLMSFYPVFAHCRVLQDFEMVQSPSGNPSQHYCSSPSNQSTSSDPGPCGTWAQKASYDG